MNHTFWTRGNFPTSFFWTVDYPFAWRLKRLNGFLAFAIIPQGRMIHSNYHRQIWNYYCVARDYWEDHGMVLDFDCGEISCWVFDHLASAIRNCGRIFLLSSPLSKDLGRRFLDGEIHKEGASSGWISFD